MRDPSDTPIDSEHYRQELVRDGQRRFDEWHSEFLKHQEEFIQSVDNESYRQMLVRDGQRRFDEWHGEFLRYQKKFIQEQEQN